MVRTPLIELETKVCLPFRLQIAPDSNTQLPASSRRPDAEERSRASARVGDHDYHEPLLQFETSNRQVPFSF